MKPFDYALAENEAGALAALERGYRPKAGGIDLLDLLKEREEAPDAMVSIAALRGVEPVRREPSGALVLDPLMTLAELEAAMAAPCPALAQSIAQAATPQIRAVATIGGNLLQRPRCWYFRSADFPCLKKGGSTCYAVEGENRFHALIGGGPCHIVHASSLAHALVALDGQLTLTSRKGTRTVSAEQFFTLPDANIAVENQLATDELLTAITIPRALTESATVEFKEKQTFDWPLAAATAARHPSGWRVVLGFVAPTPWRDGAAETVLGTTADVSPALAARAADAALADATPMSNNAWRLPLARAAVRRAILQANGKEIDA